MNVSKQKVLTFFSYIIGVKLMEIIFSFITRFFPEPTDFPLLTILDLTSAILYTISFSSLLVILYYLNRKKLFWWFFIQLMFSITLIICYRVVTTREEFMVLLTINFVTGMTYAISVLSIRKLLPGNIILWFGICSLTLVIISYTVLVFFPAQFMYTQLLGLLPMSALFVLVPKVKRYLEQREMEKEFLAETI